jgi:outer membrane receptor protein involved in Fe transport
MASTPGSLTGAQLLAGSPFCNLINREPTNTAGAFSVPGSGIDRNYDAAFTNLGGTETSGIDVQVNWSADFADMGPLQVIPGSVNLNVVGNFLKEFSESPFPGANFVNYTGTTFAGGQYDFRAFSTIGYNVGPASVGARVRFLSPINPLPTATPGTKRTASHTEVDLFGRWSLNETIELRGGIDNVLDEQAEVAGATPFNNALSTSGAQYDLLGRRFFVGATLRY